MSAKHLAAGLVALAALAAPALAGDTFRLGLPASMDAPTLDLGARPSDLTPDAELAYYRGGYRGGYGGYRGGYYGGYRGGYYGGLGYRAGYYGGYGFRGGYYGGYRGGYYGGFGGGYYGGYRSFGYYPRYSGYYYPSYYSYYPTFTSAYSYYCPISITRLVTVPTMPRVIDNLPDLPGKTLPSPTPGVAPLPMPPAANDGTFQYDGGPRSPVPVPSVTESPARSYPTRPMVVEDLVVSTQPEKTSGKWVYPAYGEAPRRSGR